MQMPETDPAWFRIGIREVPPGMISNPGQVWSRVQDIFTEFCRAGSRFAAGNAYWLTEPLEAISLKPHELVVYLIPDSTNSLIKRFFRAQFYANPPGPNTLGLTAVQGTGNLSEVYVKHP